METLNNTGSNLKKEIAKLRKSCKNGPTERELEIAKKREKFFKKAELYSKAQEKAKKEIKNEIDKSILEASIKKGEKLTVAEEIQIGMKSAVDNMVSAFDYQWKCIITLDNNMDSIQSLIDQFQL